MGEFKRVSEIFLNPLRITERNFPCEGKNGEFPASRTKLRDWVHKKYYGNAYPIEA